MTHHLSSVYFANQPQHVSDIFVAHYHEVYCIPYILESNPHTFYSFRGLRIQMRIRIACGIRFAVVSWILEKK